MYIFYIYFAEIMLAKCNLFYITYTGIRILYRHRFKRRFDEERTAGCPCVQYDGDDNSVGIPCIHHDLL